MRRLIIRRIANLHFKYIATTQKGRRIDTPCGAYPALFPNMPTPERKWPRADSEIAADAFVGASGRKIRMSAFGG